MRLIDKNKAIELRMKGFSYNEIRAIIPNLSKGTISGWLKGIELNQEQKVNILNRAKAKIDKGRIKGAWSNKLKSKKRINRISEIAKNEYEELSQNPLFFIGLALYWAEGSKKNRYFQFMNSDPVIISVMVKWLRELFHIDNRNIIPRIYIHEIYKNEKCEVYWSKIIKIPVSNFGKTVYKPTSHKVKKNIAYKGCCRIEVRGSELFWKVQAWQKIIARI